MKKISELLAAKRKEKGLSLDDVEREIKIKKQYLEAIEKGEFMRLHSESYAQGFVKNYASFLDIPTSQSIPLFRREYELRQSPSIVPEFRKTQNKFNKKLFFNTKALIVIGIFITLGTYVFFQYSSLFFPPALDVESPRNGQTITGNVIEVSGKTDPYATVTVEGEEVYVSLSGEFSKSLYAFSGENRIEIVAKNRFGNEETREIMVKAE